MSKKVKCLDPKTYSLTKGKEYDILEESEKVITIFNDRGLRANYNSKLFEKTGLSDSEVLESYKVKYGISDSDYDESVDSIISIKTKEDVLLQWNILCRDKFTAFDPIFCDESIDGPAITVVESLSSCSILEINGLDSLSEFINRLVENLNIEFWPEGNSKQDFINRMFMDFIKCIAHQYKTVSAFMLLSTVEENNAILNQSNLLDQYAVQKVTGNNPNTNNNVSIWLVDISVFDA